MTQNKRPLIVKRLDTREEVHRVETTPDRFDRVMMGMLMNLNTSEFFIDDSAFDDVDLQ